MLFELLVGRVETVTACNEAVVGEAVFALVELPGEFVEALLDRSEVVLVDADLPLVRLWGGRVATMPDRGQALLGGRTLALFELLGERVEPILDHGQALLGSLTLALVELLGECVEPILDRGQVILGGLALALFKLLDERIEAVLDRNEFRFARAVGLLVDLPAQQVEAVVDLSELLLRDPAPALVVFGVFALPRAGKFVEIRIPGLAIKLRRRALVVVRVRAPNGLDALVHRGIKDDGIEPLPDRFAGAAGSLARGFARLRSHSLHLPRNTRFHARIHLFDRQELGPDGPGGTGARKRVVTVCATLRPRTAVFQLYGKQTVNRERLTGAHATKKPRSSRGGISGCRPIEPGVFSCARCDLAVIQGPPPLSAGIARRVHAIAEL